MQANDRKISLGFTPQEFSPGVHICQIVGNDDERVDAVMKFLLSGLQAGERASCFSENVTEAMVADYLGQHGIQFEDVRESGAFALAGTRDVYFSQGRFAPDRMLNMLAEYHADSITQGFPAARVIGEMTPDVQHVDGGHRLLEYEARVSMLLREHPVTAVCQYDARRFDGATIMDVLKVHQWMVVRGSVVYNPFFIEPEEFLDHS